MKYDPAAIESESAVGESGIEWDSLPANPYRIESIGVTEFDDIRTAVKTLKREISKSRKHALKARLVTEFALNGIDIRADGSIPPRLAAQIRLELELHGFYRMSFKSWYRWNCSHAMIWKVFAATSCGDRLGQFVELRIPPNWNANISR